MIYCGHILSSKSCNEEKAPDKLSGMSDFGCPNVIQMCSPSTLNISVLVLLQQNNKKRDKREIPLCA
ncbi:hypothetical protein L596_006339 [Steinernema carpocapsae]|uniref:Uncharacterized protein n=1 Tax=Steinernema carpocapsae TaxID=34508 RepID=A0A4U8V3U2_STECR|nr:hypothetical protein L596_006339 [Steinernema carpocapsae]